MYVSFKVTAPNVALTCLNRCCLVDCTLANSKSSLYTVTSQITIGETLTHNFNRNNNVLRYYLSGK